MFLVKVCIFFLMAAVSLFGQNDTSFYSVRNDKNYYYFLSNHGIMIYDSPLEGEFVFNHSINGNFNSATPYAINNHYLAVYNNDTLFIHQKSAPFNLLTFERLDSAITVAFPFGNDFLIVMNSIMKLISLTNDSIVIKDNNLAVYSGQHVSYPYFVQSRSIYKYVEGFGYYKMHNLNDHIQSLTVYKNRIVYHTWYQPAPQGPPDECDLKGRMLSEPDFPIYLDYHNWGYYDYLSYTIPIRTASDKYLRLWTDPSSKGGLIYTYSGDRIYQETTVNPPHYLFVTDKYFFRLGDRIEYSTSTTNPAVFHVIETVTEVNEEDFNISYFKLYQNYPNPFNPTTKIAYQIAEFGSVNLKIYDVLGNEVAVLVNEEKSPGEYEVEFNAAALSSGVYFYQLKCGSFIQTHKMVLIR